jgi:AcrR family transcriptional regulator
MEAACQHLSCKGAESLSLRALARKVGVSQTAPYRHFKTKNCLFADIATCGFEEMAVALRKKSEFEHDDYISAITEIGVGYVEWALENPEKYQLFFDSVLVDFSEYPELQAAGDACFDILIEAIKKGVEKGVFIDRPVDELAVSLWAAVHGVTSLLLAKVHKLDEINRLDGGMGAMRYLRDNTRSVVGLLVKGISKTP